MNFGKHYLKKKKEQIGKAGHAGVVAVLVLLAVFAACLTVTICLGLGTVNGIIANAPDIDDINISPTGFSTYIYDADGNQLQKLTSVNANRTAVSLENVPKDLQHAVVAIEDERFYVHNGIDIQGIIRALFTGIKNKFRFTEGASTITQQLLKNNVFTTWTEEKSLMDRIKRKFQEQYLAVLLEEKLNDKNLILENYLNTINLGAGTYGVQAASRKYFGKDVSELTLSESTVIAGITQNPSKYNPIRHPDKNAERRERVLEKMVEQGYISQEQMDEALADNVYDRIAAAQEAADNTTDVYSYFVDELTSQVVTDLMEQLGYSEKQAYQMLYSGGLRIETTMDSDMQAIMDREFENEANFPANTQYTIDWALSVTHADGEQQHYSKEMLRKYFRDHGDPEFDLLFDSTEEAQAVIDDYKSRILRNDDTIIAERTSFSPEPQASMVIIDQSTGYVKAIRGGRGIKTASLTLNRATDTYRQPGSTFKVLASYATALDQYNMSLATTYVDEPYEYLNGRKVNNWLTNTYQGAMTIRNAIVNSVNVIAVKTITDVTPYAAYQQLLKFGFTSLDPVNDVYQPLALGGIYNGVSNLELTAAYASLANGGTYTKPIFYTRIWDQQGNLILKNEPQTSQAVSPDTAFLLTSAMQDVVTRGTGQAMQLPNGMPVAGKTGTTSGYNDVWFVGYPPYLTCGVWAGYGNNEKLAADAHTYHWTLWKNVMAAISADQEVKAFTIPSDISQAVICQETGHLANQYCPNTLTEYFTADTIPTEVCTAHKAAPVPEPTPIPTITPTPSPTPTPTEDPLAPETPGDSSGETPTDPSTPTDPDIPAPTPHGPAPLSADPS